MPLPAPTFLIRHGRDKYDSPELSGAGIAQAEQACASLLAKNLGRTSIILSSRATRAMATACIIAEGLGAPIISGSPKFTRYGSYPHGLQSLDELLLEELAQTGRSEEDLASGPLVVVTHSPLIAAALGYGTPGGERLDELVPYGSVHMYEPDSWQPLPTPQLQPGL